MLLDSVFSIDPYVALTLLISLGITRGIYNRYGHGIHHIPGPFLASWTEWWPFFIMIWGWRPELTHIKLHEQYGDVVRIGPKNVIVRDPEGVRKIYGLNAGYIKSDFYPVQEMVLNGKVQTGFFTTKDEAFHAKLRRTVANAYAMTSLLQYEPLVDSTISAFTRQLDKFVDKPGPEGLVDFGTWLQWYAFDVIGELTFSKRLGFLDEARDVDNIISSNEKLLDYFALIGQVPWLDGWLLKNPIRLWLAKHGFIKSTSPAGMFAKERMAERLAQIASNRDTEKGEEASASWGSMKGWDFLSKFLEAQKKSPDIMDDRRVTSFCALNMFAGSDTTAISLRAVFYYLMKHPAKLEKLMEELEDPNLGNRERIVAWGVSQKMPYLCAVIQEALRLHPAVGLPLERTVPANGLQIGDTVIPPGTVVGTTAWGLHHNKSVFGPDPEAFRPERWIESPEEQIKLMTGMFFAFGMGSRTCLGKNVSLLEIHKLVPTLLRRYEFSFPQGQGDWKVHNAWFARQSDFKVRIQIRKEKHD